MLARVQGKWVPRVCTHVLAVTVTGCPESDTPADGERNFSASWETAACAFYGASSLHPKPLSLHLGFAHAITSQNRHISQCDEAVGHAGQQ